METKIETVALARSFRELNADRSSFQRAFVERMCPLGGTIGNLLDIGCGPELPSYLSKVHERATLHDGVDPSDDILRHPDLDRRWHGFFESCQVPHEFYDNVLAYNVLEHISEGTPFFSKVADVLVPGGSFWALTPHARHPFAWLSNAVRIANLKRAYRSAQGEGVNAYASYYRLNSVRSVLRLIDHSRFARAEFYYLPCAQWDWYFPRGLRFVPHLYDLLLGRWYGPAMLLLAFRLEKIRTGM
jgi:SAM-dependent methyltransferase